MKKVAIIGAGISGYLLPIYLKEIHKIINYIFLKKIELIEFRRRLWNSIIS